MVRHKHGRHYLRQYRAFKKARAFVRSLSLKSQNDWFNYCNSGKKPDDIPTAPGGTDADAGWLGMGDWLGTGTVATYLHQYRSFKKARAFVRSLSLKSQNDWVIYCKSGKKPDDIPVHPDRTYAKMSWVGYGDWLGTGTVATRSRQYRAFKKARAFVRDLGLKSGADWFNYCNSGKKPDDIPAPSGTYADAGWLGMGDWLGTGRRRGTGWRVFKDARVFVRGLGVKSCREWQVYCRSGKKPDDIPAAPHFAYANNGWSGYGDWFGTGTVAPRLRQYRSFKKARTVVRDLGLKSQIEWRDYLKLGEKPDDIPSNPDHVYAEAGWTGYGDWLGYVRKRQT